MHFADLDAVTLDAYGTLVTLIDPRPALAEALGRRGVEPELGQIGNAFAAEVAYYRPRSHAGRDPESLAELREACVRVFLAELGASIDAAAFVPDFIGALVFEPLEGVVDTLDRLGASGLLLGVVSNWDYTLPEQLARAGLDGRFDAVVTSAEAGRPKPDPTALNLALKRLGVDPGRVVHVGDEGADADAARAAGVRFARSPLPAAFEGWT
jgi:HAD superfamily hydrolase (TIGR01509 family)